MAPRLYTIRTLLENFQPLTEATIRRAVAAGLLEAHQLTGPGSQLWFTKRAVDRWLASTKVQPEAAGAFRASLGSTDTDFAFDY